MSKPSLKSAVIKVEKSLDRNIRRVKFVVEKPCASREENSMAFSKDRKNVSFRRVEENLSALGRSRSRSPVNSSDQRQLTLSEQVKELSRRLDEVLVNRSRDLERRDGRSKMKPKRRWICWFHYRHGAQARKCEKQKGGNPDIPCIFFGERNEVYTRPQQN